MRRNMIETIMGAVVLLVAISFVILAFQSTGTVNTARGYTVTAEFDDVSGITPGTEVRMAGVKVGSVLSQALDPETYFATVSMQINDGIQLPMDSSIRIIPDGLLGGNFMAIEPGGDEEMIEPGGSIQHTQGVINVVDLLGRFIFSAAEQAGGADQGPQ